jgi:hypothetical protein
MVRRKGELSSTAIDRGWPHQIMVPDLGPQMWLSRWPSVCERHHTVFVNGRTHHVYCFADPADAESFFRVFEVFGAEWFDPKRRRGTGGWHLVKPKA